MTNRIAVALVTLVGLVGPLLGQTPVAPLPSQPLMPGPVVAPPDGPSPYLEDGSPPCSPETFWARGEVVVGWLRGMRLPPLVTTSPPGTPTNLAGVLGGPETAILVGGGPVDNNARVGARFLAGYWFQCLDRLGAEAGFLFLPGQSQHWTAASDGSSILARPIFDATNNNAGTAVLIAYPGLSSGSIGVTATSKNFYVANLDLAERMWTTDHFRMTALVGYRYMAYADDLQMSSSAFPTVAGVVPGTRLSTLESFQTFNQFNGVEGGFRWEFFQGDWSLELLTKLAYGRVGQRTTITGINTNEVPGSGASTTSGALLALPSNIGILNNAQWLGAIDLGCSIGWQVTDHMRLRVGYLFLYWPGVARAGDQIDLVINPNLVQGTRPVIPPFSAGPIRPLLTVQNTDFWVQSITCGVEFRY